MTRIVSLSVLTALLVFLGLTFYRVVAPFLLPLFVAAVVSVLVRPLYQRACEKFRGRTNLAAGAVTGGALLLILVPLVVGIVAAASQMVSVAGQVRTFVTDLNAAVDREVGGAGPDVDGNDAVAATVDPAAVMSAAEPDAAVADGAAVADDAADAGRGDYRRVVADAVADRLSLDRDGRVDGWLRWAAGFLPDRYSDLRDAVAAETRDLAPASAGVVGAGLGYATGLLGTGVSLLIGLGMFAIGLYYFLTDGPKMLAATQDLVPVQTHYQDELLDRFNTVLRAVVFSTFVAAIAQGFLTAGAIALCGFGHFFVLFLVATLASLVPLLGAWLVWGPFAAALFVQGHWVAGTLLTLFGLGVVGTLDNVIRTYVLNSDAKLHPLLAFVCVLGGLQVMGLWGIFIGPIVASCLHALLKIYNAELKELSREKFFAPRAAEEDAPEEVAAKPRAVPEAG